MKLIVVRHGETKENAGRIVQGQRHGTLSELGEKQILALAKDLSRKNFAVIYTSDLNRCIKTAEAVAKYHPKTQFVSDKRLREFSFGVLEGLPLASKKHRFSKIGLKLPLGLFKIEKPQVVKKRIMSFLQVIHKKHRNDTVLIVTHGGPIRVLLSMSENKSFASMLAREVDNCSVWEFDSDALVKG